MTLIKLLRRRVGLVLFDFALLPHLYYIAYPIKLLLLVVWLYCLCVEVCVCC